MLLERSAQLARLATSLDAVAAERTGRVVLVGGEASAEAHRLGIAGKDR